MLRRTLRTQRFLCPYLMSKMGVGTMAVPMDYIVTCEHEETRYRLHNETVTVKENDKGYYWEHPSFGRSDIFETPTDAILGTLCECLCFNVSIKGVEHRAMKKVIEVQHVPLDAGGYDESGSYWGIDQPLWCVFIEENGQEHTKHVRAPNADRASEKALGEA